VQPVRESRETAEVKNRTVDVTKFNPDGPAECQVNLKRPHGQGVQSGPASDEKGTELLGFGLIHLVRRRKVFFVFLFSF
jgi:hypothetical protein